MMVMMMMTTTTMTTTTMMMMMAMVILAGKTGYVHCASVTVSHITTPSEHLHHTVIGESELNGMTM